MGDLGLVEAPVVAAEPGGRDGRKVDVDPPGEGVDAEGQPALWGRRTERPQRRLRRLRQFRRPPPGSSPFLPLTSVRNSSAVRGAEGAVAVAALGSTRQQSHGGVDVLTDDGNDAEIHAAEKAAAARMGGVLRAPEEHDLSSASRHPDHGGAGRNRPHSGDNQLVPLPISPLRRVATTSIRAVAGIAGWWITSSNATNSRPARPIISVTSPRW